MLHSKFRKLREKLISLCSATSSITAYIAAYIAASHHVLHLVLTYNKEKFGRPCRRRELLCVQHQQHKDFPTAIDGEERELQQEKEREKGSLNVLALATKNSVSGILGNSIIDALLQQQTKT